MTKEDIKQICQIYDNFRSERDAATIAYNSDDTFWEHILATYNLSQPSLPSDLDEAARLSAVSVPPIWPEKNIESHIRGFKAGAEWMAGQGVKAHCVESSNPVSDSPDKRPHCITLIYEENENTPYILGGDEVEIILRKKQ